MRDATVEKVQIASNEKFTDPVHVVPLDAPIIICDQFKGMHVGISIEDIVRMSPSERQPNAFEVLMASSRDIVLPNNLSPPEGKELQRDQQLYNDLIGTFFGQ